MNTLNNHPRLLPLKDPPLFRLSFFLILPLPLPLPMPLPPPPPLIQSSIAFLKSGERPEAELTVIDPPTTVGGDREMLLTKVLKCVSSLLGTGSTSGCCRCSGAGSSSAAVIRAPSAAGAATSPGGTSDEAHGRPKKSLAAQSNISDRSLPFCSCLSVLAGLGVFGGIGAAVIVFAATHSRDVGWSSIKAPSSSRYK